jgi:hypothetical protein
MIHPTIEKIDEIIDKLKALKKAKEDYRGRIRAYDQVRGYLPDNRKKHELWSKFVQPILNEIEADFAQFSLYSCVQNYGTGKYQSDAIKDMVFGGEFTALDEKSESDYMDSLINEFETVRQNIQAKSAKIGRNTTPSKCRRIIGRLRNHPQSYGLTGGVIFLIIFFVVGFFKPQWRNWCWGVAGIAFLVLILSLLGGRSRQ